MATGQSLQGGADARQRTAGGGWLARQREPHAIPIDAGQRLGHQQGEGAERPEGRTEADIGHAGDLDQAHHHADQKHIRHHPRAQVAQGARNAANARQGQFQPDGRMRIDDAQQVERRQHHDGQNQQHSQGRIGLGRQGGGRIDQAEACRDATGGKGDELEGQRQHQHHQARHRQCQGALHGMGVALGEQMIATRAAGALAGLERRQCHDEVAALAGTHPPP